MRKKIEDNYKLRKSMIANTKVFVTKKTIVTTILLAILSVIPVMGRTLGGVENQVLLLINNERAKFGLSALAMDGSLRAIARTHSEDMLTRNFFSHRSPDGISFQERITRSYSGPFSQAGENIWTGSGYDSSNSQRVARMIVGSWLSSPGHRANMLDPSFTQTGVGVATRGKEIRATQIFIKK
jgi:uncharacterized protein YkwD